MDYTAEHIRQDIATQADQEWSVSGADLRVRLDRLGLTPAQFATITGSDDRTLRRMIAETLPVTRTTLARLAALEAEADEAIRDLTHDAADGIPITLPRYLAKGATADTARPASWWHAIATRLLDQHPNAAFTYETEAS